MLKIILLVCIAVKFCVCQYQNNNITTAISEHKEENHQIYKRQAENKTEEIINNINKELEQLFYIWINETLKENERWYTQMKNNKMEEDLMDTVGNEDSVRRMKREDINETLQKVMLEVNHKIHQFISDENNKLAEKKEEMKNEDLKDENEDNFQQFRTRYLLQIPEDENSREDSNEESEDNSFEMTREEAERLENNIQKDLEYFLSEYISEALKKEEENLEELGEDNQEIFGEDLVNINEDFLRSRGNFLKSVEDFSRNLHEDFFGIDEDSIADEDRDMIENNIRRDIEIFLSKYLSDGLKNEEDEDEEGEENEEKSGFGKKYKRQVEDRNGLEKIKKFRRDLLPKREENEEEDDSFRLGNSTEFVNRRIAEELETLLHQWLRGSNLRQNFLAKPQSHKIPKREIEERKSKFPSMDATANAPPEFLPLFFQKIFGQVGGQRFFMSDDQPDGFRRVKRQSQVIPQWLQQIAGGVDANMVVGTYQAMVMPMSTVTNLTGLFRPILQGIQGMIPGAGR